ncbi:MULTISPECIES: hypothetical protein [unclassified Polaribacter]|uniref:hypothetical protein n=1 Tax=unclassified Polaribacter TaxID=196858 RepID=UPI0011BF1EBE|nr:MULTISPECIES: hypothetical protein [unclassified Polaribacter]TXD46458.1 hypothetical protein ES043_18460 [Polaribacter sp. IC063]TXD54913.1 hypothetical protein ES044_18270 [Polaribacter sp. IC066]
MNYAVVDGLKLAPQFNYGNSKNFNTDSSGLTEKRDIYFDYTWDNYINYNTSFNKVHNLTMLLGNSVYKTTGEFTGFTGNNLLYKGVPVSSFENANLGNAEEVLNFYTDEQLENEENTFDARLLSYFFRFQYNYKEKYLLSAVIRRDASSKFGPNNQVGFFPSMSLGWNITEESFLQNNSWLNALKLRVSYGIIGNDRIPDNKWVSLLNGDAIYASSDVTQNSETPTDQRIFGLAEGTLGNPEFKWEERNYSAISGRNGFLLKAS